MIDIVGNPQAEMIAILSKRPDYLKRTVLDQDYFVEPFKSMYLATKSSLEKYGLIDTGYISSFKGVNRDDYVSILWEEIPTDITTFKTLEENILDAYRKREYLNLAEQLRDNQIDIYQFKFGVNALEMQNTNTLQRIDCKEICSILERSASSKVLKFTEYQKLKAKSNIFERDLVVVAGKTGRGKTGFCLNIANDLLTHYPVMYISMELSAETIRTRLTAMNTDIPVSNILSPSTTVRDNGIAKIKSYGKSMDKKEFYVTDTSQTISSIERIIGSFPQEKHFVVFVDHLGYIKCKGKDIRERTTESIKRLRQMSMDFNCTIFCISHVSRTNDRVPQLSMLKESGEIENSARKVLFLWEEQEDDYGVYIMKNDSGSLGMIPIDYNKNTQKVREKETAGGGLRIPR